MKIISLFALLACFAGLVRGGSDEESREVAMTGLQIPPFVYAVKVVPVKMVNSFADSEFFFVITEWWCNGVKVFSWSSELISKDGSPYIYEAAPHEEKEQKKPRPDGGDPVPV